MFLERLGSAEQHAAQPPRAWAQVSRLLLLPLVLGLGLACSKRTSSANDPGKPPTITTQPVDTTTISGRPVSLTVGAEGAPTLLYQWTKDGVDIVGALAATYTISSPQPYHAGTYAVTVTNPNGTIKSGNAQLIVQTTVGFRSPVAVAVDAGGTLYVSDVADHTIWKVDTTNHKTLLAGTSGVAGSVDGVGSQARFRSPGGLALDPSGNLLVADSGNHTLRRIAPDGTVTTLAGSPGLTGSLDGLGAAARFNTPFGVAVDATGNAFVTDTLNHTVRRVATDGTVTTYAGAPGVPGLADGLPGVARFSQPNAISRASDGTLYIADYGNSAIRTIAPSGTVGTLAGQVDNHGWADGAVLSAKFNLPVGLAQDASGVVWVADTYNHVIRRIAQGTVSTLAGSGTNPGNADGTGTAGTFYQPCGIAILPGGDLVVADTGNHQLRRVTTAGVVSTYIQP